MKKTIKKIIAIGGGELKTKQTLEIDRHIAHLVKEKAADERGNALFIPTASHDSMPYFNSFRKTYTSVFDIKVDVALMCYGEMDTEKIAAKIDKADMIYVGGGDTLFMLDLWEKRGIDKFLISAYQKGAIICGLSAGGICWFDKMYTDGGSTGLGKYNLQRGLGVIGGIICPHYQDRHLEFDSHMKDMGTDGFAVEDCSAVVFENGKYAYSLSCGGNSYIIGGGDKKRLKPINLI